MQKKKHSLIESVTNTVIGFLISLLIQLIIYPVMGIPVTLSQNFVITAIFTIASILRGYVIRRLFNCTIEKQSLTSHHENIPVLSEAKHDRK